MPRPAAFVLTVALSCLSLPGCGYSLAGRGSSLPVYIRTIGVPLFANATSVFDVEQKLTERVRLEFIGRGKYQVLSEEAGADAVLKGDIIAITVRPTAYTQEQQASRYEITVIVKIEFKEAKTGKILYENPAQTFHEEYEVTSGQVASDPAFLGQNQNALERIGNDFAKTLVSAILEAF